MRIHRSYTQLNFAIVLLIGLLYTEARADDDVYNFYFQKAPGPTTVIQGGSEKTLEKSLGKPLPPDAMANPAVIANPAISSPATIASPPSAKVDGASQAAVAQEPMPKMYIKNWEVNFGSSVVADHAGKWKGESLGLQYNLNQYFGLQGGLTRTSQAENRQYAPSTNWQDPFDIYLGGVLTPITIHAFSHSLISLSGLGGFMTGRTRIWSDWESQGSRDSKGNGQNRETRGYVGAQVALNFADSFALLGQVRVRTDDKAIGQGMVGAVIRF